MQTLSPIGLPSFFPEPHRAAPAHTAARNAVAYPATQAVADPAQHAVEHPVQHASYTGLGRGRTPSTALPRGAAHPRVPHIQHTTPPPIQHTAAMVPSKKTLKAEHK